MSAPPPGAAYPHPATAGPPRQDPWLVAGLATLISFGINTAAQLLALVVAVAGFFVAFDTGSFLGTLEDASTDTEVSSALEEFLGDGGAWAGYGLLLLATGLVLLVVLALSALVVTRFLRRRGVAQPALAAWAGTATMVVVMLAGFLIVGPFVLPVGYVLMWVVVGLVAQAA
jgi:hypothetical protein